MQTSSLEDCGFLAEIQFLEHVQLIVLVTNVIVLPTNKNWFENLGILVIKN
jgi:hypothetical protein